MMNKEKSNRNLMKIILFALLITAFLTGCAGQTQPGEPGAKSLDAPFTGASWSSSFEDVKKLHGEPAKSYDSIYNGTTYVFNSSYRKRDGVLKFMFDDKGALMCVAFTYVADTPDEVLDLYNEIHSMLNLKFGESGYQTNQETNYGDVWHRDEGDVIISCMTTSEINSLQYSYLNPVVSKYQMEDAAAKNQNR